MGFEIDFFKQFVRQQHKIELKEITKVLLLVLHRLIDAVPDICQVHHQSRLDLCLIHRFRSEVPDHEQQFLFGRLLKQFQIALENHLEDFIVRRSMLAYILRPHIDEHDV